MKLSSSRSILIGYFCVCIVWAAMYVLAYLINPHSNGVSLQGPIRYIGFMCVFFGLPAYISARLSGKAELVCVLLVAVPPAMFLVFPSQDIRDYLFVVGPAFILALTAGLTARIQRIHCAA